MNDKTCKMLVDNDFVRSLSHVDDSAPGYICSRFPREPQCYWVDLSKTLYIGHGPELSNEQFAQIEKLFADADTLKKMEDALYKAADDIVYDEEHNLRPLNRLQRRRVDEINYDLSARAGHQKTALQSAAENIAHIPPLGVTSALADPETFEKLRGSLQTVPQPVWACPGWAPVTPVDGFGTRLLTQMEEGQCTLFDAGTRVRVDEIGSSARVCVAPVGSVRPCQWMLAVDLDAALDVGNSRIWTLWITDQSNGPPAPRPPAPQVSRKIPTT
jgi:hypothetical protein